MSEKPEKPDQSDAGAAGEAEPKGTPHSDRYAGETAHQDETEAHPPPKQR